MKKNCKSSGIDLVAIEAHLLIIRPGKHLEICVATILGWRTKEGSAPFLEYWGGGGGGGGGVTAPLVPTPMQAGIPEPATMYVKKCNISIVLFSRDDYLDHLPWFEYKSTPFWSALVCGMLVLCYQDSDLIVSAFSEWVCLIRHFVI